MPYQRYHRDPAERDAAQAFGCAAFLVMFGLGALLALHQATNKPPPYRPDVPDAPQQRRVAPGYWLRGVLLCIGFCVLAFAVPIDTTGRRDVTLGLISLAGAGVFIAVSVFSARNLVAVRQNMAAKWTRPFPAMVYSIYPPREKLDPATHTRFIHALLQRAPQLSFRIVGDGRSTTWQVVDPKAAYPPDLIVDTIRSHYGDRTQVVYEQVLGTSAQAQTGSATVHCTHRLFQLNADYAFPLLAVDKPPSQDALLPLAQRLDFLRPEWDEQIVYTLVVLVASADAPQVGLKRLEKGSLGDPEAFTRRQLDLLHGKLAGPLYHSFLMVTLQSQQKERLESLAAVANDVLGPPNPELNRLRVSTNLRYYRLEPGEPAWQYAPEYLLACIVGLNDADWRQLLLVLHPAELAALWHLPDENFAATKIVWAGVPLPEALTVEEPADVAALAEPAVYIGGSTGPGKPQTVTLTNADRAHHLYISGKTGMGKSTLLHHLIHQDIAAGRGVAVLDPHGSLIERILACSIPHHRLDDLVLLECGRADFPVPLNPFRVPPGVSFATAFNYLYWLWRKIYQRSWQEGRMDRVLQNTLRALLTDPEATPLDISRLLMHASYRAETIERLRALKLRTPALYWGEEYNSLSPGQQAQFAQPILNRLDVLLGNPALEKMTCHPSNLNFRQMMAENRIVLINLAGESIRAEVDSLGAMFLAGFYMALHALGTLEDDRLPRFYLYVDEVERFVTSPIPDMFSEARKFGLSMTLANQYFDQLSSDTLNGILGNVGTLLAFECGEKDARALDSQFAPEIERQTLQNLGAFHVAVKTCHLGATLPGFLIETKPPLKRVSDVAAVRRHALARNGFLKAEYVEAWLDERYYGEANEPVLAGGDGLGDYE